VGRLEGLKNGELLAAAEVAGYDVLVTIDRGIAHQQNLAGRKIGLVILRARSNQLDDLTPLVETVLQALPRMQPGEVVTLSAPV
jgi:hypothetical protein